MRCYACFIAFLTAFSLHSQTLETQIQAAYQKIQALEGQKKIVQAEIEGLKFQKINRDLDVVGLPTLLSGDALVSHAAMRLAYCEEHEQARWVAHVILPDVMSGSVFRSNDFRPDPDVTTGSAVEADYFLKQLQPDSTWKYDGFGYDRGHLAPSADFRWSQTALSESYFYSNMSPQRAELNREAWGDLEDKVRGYLYRNPEVQLYVVTGPLLEPDLSVIERGPNKVSIPRSYWKVVLDLQNQRGIGFMLPNRGVTEPLTSFVVSIKEIEALTGLNFFSNLPDDIENKVEAQKNPVDWLSESALGEVAPMFAPDLPRNHFNTTQAKLYKGKNDVVHVCGTIVGARRSRAGNILLNFDRQFPNQVFTVFIKKEFIPNFSYDPEHVLKGKVICAKGRVVDLDGTPTMFVEGEGALERF
jgi:endonuclease G, mitochondrial